ncbi:MAG: hypothetical protein HY815_33810, partial [Candidatus Riflebacteria bacterium]|nr:hypothetical protein [Candidatus Riflebacteria bacterium]
MATGVARGAAGLAAVDRGVAADAVAMGIAGLVGKGTAGLAGGDGCVTGGGAAGTSGAGEIDGFWIRGDGAGEWDWTGVGRLAQARALAASDESR